MHNTFIQFGVPLDGALPEKQHVSTAPALMGQASLQSAMLAATEAARVHHPEDSWSLDFAASDGTIIEPGSPVPPHVHSPTKLASPKKVPVTRYALSTSSARAAGLPANATGAVFANYNAECVPGRAGTVGTRATSSTADDGNSLSGGANSLSGGADTAVAVCDFTGEEGVESSNDARSTQHSPTVASTPTLAVDSDLPSLGSAKHAEGLCKRCCFFPKGRCVNGRNCEFCHFEHEKRKRKKKKKGIKRGDEQVDNSDSEGASPTFRGAALEGTAFDTAAASPHPELSMPASPATPILQEAGFASTNLAKVLFDSAPPPSPRQLEFQQHLHQQLQQLQQQQQQQQALQAQQLQAQAQGQSPAQGQAHSNYFSGAHADWFGLYGSMGYNQVYAGGPYGDMNTGSSNCNFSAAAGVPGARLTGGSQAGHAAMGAGMAVTGPVGALPPPR